MLFSASLIACASAPEGSDLSEYGLLDASSIIQADAGRATEPMTGEVLPPSGIGSNPPPIVPNVPMSMADAGASAPRDAGTTPMPADAGMTSPPPSDSGAPVTPPPMEASTPPPPVDAGSDTGSAMQPDTGAATNMCAAAPSYSTASACGQCTCMKCASQVTQCYASNESAKNSQCAAVRSCAEQNRCTGETCYCGDSFLCLSPSGACRSVIETAAGSTDSTEVTRQADDTSTALGRSKAVGDCQMANCRSECQL